MAAPETSLSVGRASSDLSLTADDERRKTDAGADALKISSPARVGRNLAFDQSHIRNLTCGFNVFPNLLRAQNRQCFDPRQASSQSATRASPSGMCSMTASRRISRRCLADTVWAMRGMCEASCASASRRPCPYGHNCRIRAGICRSPLSQIRDGGDIAKTARFRPVQRQTDFATGLRVVAVNSRKSGRPAASRKRRDSALFRGKSTLRQGCALSQSIVANPDGPRHRENGAIPLCSEANRPCDRVARCRRSFSGPEQRPQRVTGKRQGCR